VAAQLMRAEPVGDPWVVARLRAAAADAIARADPRPAVAFLRRAFIEPVPADQRVALLQDLVQAGFLAADARTADGLDVDPVHELAADPRALQASALYLVMLLWVTGRADAALEVSERARSAATLAGDHDLALRLEARWIMLAQLPPTDALRRLEPHQARVDRDSFAGRLVDANIAWYGSLTGRPASEIAERGRRAFDGQRLVNELRDDDLMLVSFVLALLRTDELALCESIIEQILDQGRIRGAASTVAGGSYLGAYLAHLRGDVVGAEGHMRAAITAFREAGIIATLPPVTALLVDTLTDCGELDAAGRELTAAGVDGEIPDNWWFGPVLWSRGYLQLAQGNARDGVRDMLEFARRYDRDSMVATVTRPWASHAAPFLAQLGEREKASRLANRELEDARVWGTPRAIGQALRGLGLVTAGPDGIELLHESVRTLETSPARLEHARALIELGAALRRDNHRSEARGPLRRGLDLAHRCGARPLETRAAQELRATGARPRRLVLTGVDALTASERRIAEMAADGLTNREIAQALFVTVKTIETHMAHVFQKLDVDSRKQLAALLHARLGTSED
jgi:DNA-binding CsgD family transcriptional regulator